MKLCECGCGQLVKNRFVFGHQQRTLENRIKRSKIASKINKGRVLSKKTKEKISNSLKGYNHTEDTKQKMSKSKLDKYKGNSNSNWKEGISPYAPLWNRLKIEIKKRDNYKCQNLNCKGKYNNLEVHHIDFDKKNNDPNNLITLCKSCHAKKHPKGFIKNRIINKRISNVEGSK